MAYNNGFPMSYQPVYYPQQQYNSQLMQQQATQASQPMQSQQPTSSIIWVQGEAGAKSYLVAPNTTVQLWDSENQVIYLKSADASGMPSMKILDYKIREASQPQASQIVQNVVQEYVTRDELAAFEAQIREQIASLSQRKKEEKIDE